MTEEERLKDISRELALTQSELAGTTEALQRCRRVLNEKMTVARQEIDDLRAELARVESELARARNDDSLWEPGRWWRVIYTTHHGTLLWCESSDEQEAREAYRSLLPEEKPVLERQYVQRFQSEWRSVESV